MDTVTRPLTAGDVEHVRWALYAALAWNPARVLPPPEQTLAHPEAQRYHRDWGRDGDLGIAAFEQEEVVGVAYCRRFTEADHGHGYLDEETPEVAVAVRENARGRGLGARLLTELAALAAENGVPRLSLGVDPANPALRLYERLGYRVWSRDDDGVRMVLELAAT